MSVLHLRCKQFLKVRFFVQRSGRKEQTTSIPACVHSYDRGFGQICICLFRRRRNSSHNVVRAEAVGGNVVRHAQTHQFSSEHPLQRHSCKCSMKDLKPDPWTWLCFSQLFQIELLYYLYALSIILYESKKSAFFGLQQIPTAL